MSSDGLQPFVDSIERQLVRASSFVHNAKMTAQRSGDQDVRTLMVATLANLDGALAMLAALNAERAENAQSAAADVGQGALRDEE